MSEPELPLLDLFNALRAQGLPLGTTDYLDFLRALEQGEGLSDRRALLGLCQMLWASSRAEQQICARLFDEQMARVADEAARAALQAVPPSGRAAPEVPPVPPGAGSSSAATPAVPAVAMRQEPIEEAVPPSLRQVHVRIRTADVSSATDLSMPTADLSPDEYLPVRARQMTTSWRRLRRLLARGPRVEIDIDATIAAVAETGVFLAPSLRGRRVNVAGLFLLLDQQGSMAPFHPLTRALRDSALRSSGLGRVDVGQFKNVAYPGVSVGGRTVPLRAHLLGCPKSMGVLVVSDAGAARGRSSKIRIQRTIEMLRLLHEGGRRVAWLNPVPADRWDSASAGEIASHVSMFAADRAGLDAALRVLRGRRPITGPSLGRS